jgi:hypothetical protein
MKFTDLINEELTDSDVKKVKTLYAFYKAAVHRLDVTGGGLYKYVLSDDYELTTHETDGEKKILVEPKGMKMYYEGFDDTFKEMDRNDYPTLELWLIKLIRKKFAHYKIDIVII